MSEESEVPTQIAPVEQMPRAELERRCLSSLAKDSAAVLHAVSSGMNALSFATPAHGQIFDIMAVAVQNGTQGDPGDEVTQQVVRLHLTAPMAFIEWQRVQALENTSINARRHTEQVIAYFKQDKLLALLKRAYHAAKAHTVPDWNLCMEEAATTLALVNDLAADSKANSLPEMVDAYIADQNDPFKAKVTPIGIPAWDRVAGSLREGELVTLAGRPGTGKTALAIQTANAVMNRGGVVAFFSLEMTGKELVGRLAIHRTGRAGFGVGTRERDERIAEAQKLKAADKLLYVYEEKASRTLAAIESRCRLLAVSKAGLNLVIIDYLQLISSSPEMRRSPREQQVAEITRRLKLLANDLKCPVMILAQLNRESEKEERSPRLSDLRESGAIEQDSDRVWFLYTPTVDKNAPVAPRDAEIISVNLYQAKCRGGRPGIEADLQFDRPIFNFTKIASQQV